MKRVMKQIINEISQVTENMNSDEITELTLTIEQSERIFVAGIGRSGLIGKTFAMRLMHSGKIIYVVGETITPSLQSSDLLLVISASGNTNTLVNYANEAKKIGAKIALITASKQSAIGKLANIITYVPAATKYRLESEPMTIQPLGSQFDQSVHIFLDSLCVKFAKENTKNSSLFHRHTNLE